MTTFVLEVRGYNTIEKKVNDTLLLMNSFRCIEKAGYSTGVDTIFTNFEQFVVKVIVVLCCAIIQCMAQINASSSACRGERILRRFFAPIADPSTPFAK